MLLTVIITLVADAIGLVRSIVTSGASPAAWTLASLLGGMALVTLVASWIFARAAHGAEVPFTQRGWGRAVIISGLAILILALFPLEWRDSGIPGGIFQRPGWNGPAVRPGLGAWHSHLPGGKV